MRILLFLLVLNVSFFANAKEWKSLQKFQKETKKETLSASDWLKQDRKYNTRVWQNANAHNLKNNLPQEYKTIEQRRDFYWWYFTEIDKKGHEVIWPKMAYFISRKLSLVKVFPYTLFTRKSIKNHASKGSEAAFNNAFMDLIVLYNSENILKEKDALKWDEDLLYKEQFDWVESIYKQMDAKSLKSIERMAKGKGFYGLFVDKEIRFKGDISSSEERYNYALSKLRDYCKNTYK